MNDKGKRFWDNSIGNVDDDIVEEMAQTLYKKSLTDFNESDLVIVETEKKSKLPIFALVASIIAIIGVAVITGVIIANTGIFTTPLESEDESNITSEIEDDENSENTDTEIEGEMPSPDDFVLVSHDGYYSIQRYTGNAKNLVIPEMIDGKKITGIRSGAFSDCPNLDTITVPAGVTDMDLTYQPFYCDAADLVSVYVDTDNKNYASEDGVLFNKDMTELLYYPPRKTGSSYTVPEGVTDISPNAFSDSKFETLNLSHSVTSISNAHYVDNDIEYIYVPSFFTRIKKENNISIYPEPTFTGAPLIKKIILYVLLAIVAVVITIIIIRLIIKDRKQRAETAEYFRRKREEREKSEK